jgi:hypothetical protein
MSLAVAPKYKETRVWASARESWIGESYRAGKNICHEFSAWMRHPAAHRENVQQIIKSIAALDKCGSDLAQEATVEESPIFLLSTGWRAGSTLLQRILVTDPRLLIWGEPFGEMALLSRITEMVNNFLSPRDLALWNKQDNVGSSSLSTSWIATLSPPGNDFRLALRGLIDRWLGEPARQRGFSRWGLKEVRLGASEAYLLHWLFPNARFVTISRHPHACYRSLADSNWQGVFDRHPEVYVDTAAGFARHWNRLALSWSQLPTGFPCVHIKYEDLVGGELDFRDLESWLRLELEEDTALSVSVGGTAVRTRLRWYERSVINHEAADGMRALGYSK